MPSKGAELDRELTQEIKRRTTQLAQDLEVPPSMMKSLPALRDEVTSAFIKVGDVVLTMKREVRSDAPR